MFRFSLTVCVCLILGISAKPYKPWNELTDGEFQHTVMSLKEGRMEVEPPEDMDETHYEIDPHMMIWKDTKPLKDDEDLDKLYHPLMADLLNRHKENLEALSAADIQAEPWQEVTHLKNHQELEKAKDDIKDWDEVYRQARKELDVYLAPLIAGHNAGEEVRVAQPEPEKNEYGLRHRDNQGLPGQMELVRQEVEGGSEVRVHLHPEEDMDSLYHEDLSKVTGHQEDTEAVAPVNFPSQRRYSQPEEDLDHLYHQ
ncbi:uncharacterized protein si:ch211-217g15.3 [Pungitius pungitius]|uniref:uncharacterized protein si:ch211-217g15.3 n=1 Tax=Pungitius pungitius TaxID=134920 RepID=UPI00188836BE|nr:uncharacterized protein si:ch211-217g15.3 [Pungitius pungitius]